MTHRDRRGRFTFKDATARAMQFVIANWWFCYCRDLAAANDDGPGDEPAAA